MAKCNQYYFTLMILPCAIVILMIFSCKPTRSYDQEHIENQQNSVGVFYVKEAKLVTFSSRGEMLNSVQHAVDIVIEPGRYVFDTAWSSIYSLDSISTEQQTALNRISPLHQDILVMPHIPEGGYLRPPVASSPKSREHYVSLLLDWKKLTSPQDSI